MEYMPTESGEQQALFSRARLQAGKYPELDLLYHILTAADGTGVVQEEVKAGVLDLCLPVDREEVSRAIILS